MKALVLQCSLRRNGNTARLARMVADQLEAAAARRGESLELETVHLGDLDIRACRGCRTCFDRGEQHCPLRDDLPALAEKMRAAEALVLASPVYVNDVNGAAKNLIDRLAYLCHRPAFAGKCAFLLATVADSPTGHALHTMDIALRTWGFHLVGRAGFKMGALMEQRVMQERYGGDAQRIAGSLLEAVRRRRYLRPTLFSLLMFKVQQGAWQQAADPASLDYAYWKGQGWFEPRRTFFLDHRAGPLKVALARVAGALVARFVTSARSRDRRPPR